MRSSPFWSWLSLTLILAASAAQAAPPGISGAAAFRHLEAQVALGPRVPGTDAHAKAIASFEAELGRYAPRVALERFSVQDGPRTLALTNLVAVFGQGKGDVAMVAAHWDSRPRSEQDPHPAHRLQPTPGANDGASGAAVVLELARALKASPPPREVRLVLLDGEDWGQTPETMFYGSREYVRRHRGDLPAWGLLLDMVGDKDLVILREAYSEARAGALLDRVYRTAAAMGYGANFPDQGGPAIEDDHLPFLEQGVPFVDLIDFDYPQWHTVHDLPAQCSPSSLEAVGNVALRLVSAPR
ncbi:MAG TPA: M28 family peptidase [Pantanalinema sp.]